MSQQQQHNQPQQAAPAANDVPRVTAAELAARYRDYGGPFAVSGN